MPCTGYIGVDPATLAEGTAKAYEAYEKAKKAWETVKDWRDKLKKALADISDAIHSVFRSLGLEREREPLAPWQKKIYYFIHSPKHHRTMRAFVNFRAEELARIAGFPMYFPPKTAVAKMRQRFKDNYIASQSYLFSPIVPLDEALDIMRDHGIIPPDIWRKPRPTALASARTPDAPRPAAPRPAAPRPEAPRPAAPRLEAPRPSPRLETPQEFENRYRARQLRALNRILSIAKTNPKKARALAGKLARS